MWTASHAPFGQATVDEDVDGDSNAVVMNVRFPGQYFDAETGLHYNYFRYYDPSTGRYLRSDPIGLDGGMNTYGYALQNPSNLVDPLGLTPLTQIIGRGIVIAGGSKARSGIIDASVTILGPKVGVVAACVLAGVCSLNEDPTEEDPGSVDKPSEIHDGVSGICKPNPPNDPNNEKCRRRYEDLLHMYNRIIGKIPGVITANYPNLKKEYEKDCGGSDLPDLPR